MVREGLFALALDLVINHPDESQSVMPTAHDATFAVPPAIGTKGQGGGLRGALVSTAGRFRRDSSITRYAVACFDYS